MYNGELHNVSAVVDRVVADKLIAYCKKNRYVQLLNVSEHYDKIYVQVRATVTDIISINHMIDFWYKECEV